VLISGFVRMDRAFRQGYIDTGFRVEPFNSVPRLLQGALAIYVFNFAFIAGVTLLVFLPVNLFLQFIYSLLEIPGDGGLSYALLSVSDLVLSAVTVPAILFGLTLKLRDGKLPPVGEALRWGWRQFGKMLWNTFKMEISILLTALLLIVPGILTAIALIFTESIVAIEGDLTNDVRNRTVTLAKGHGWRIFFTMLPLVVVGMAAMKLFQGAAASRLWMAGADSLLAVINQLNTVAVLLIYLAVAQEKAVKGGTPPRR
jgi:hypothetical protein